MKYIYIVGVLAIIGIWSFGRNLTEMKEWRKKSLPSDSRSGVRVEIYDLQERDDNIDVNIRLHNFTYKTLYEVRVKIWVWKREGVYVKELTLISEEDPFSKRIRSGEEKFFPKKGSYYRLEGVKYSEMEDISIEIGRVVYRR